MSWLETLPSSSPDRFKNNKPKDLFWSKEFTGYDVKAVREQFYSQSVKVHERTSMAIQELRDSLTPNLDMAKDIEANSDMIWWIHGLKAILIHAKHFKWTKWGKIDWNIDTNTLVQTGRIVEGKPEVKKMNTIAKWLIDFQLWVNSPYNLADDGTLADKDAKSKLWIPKEEIGKLWPRTIAELLLYAERNKIDLPPAKGDWKFESQAEFLEKYGPLIDYLTVALKLPRNLVLAIAKKESTLWTNPRDYGWWNGVVQLTSAPLADMSWETDKPKVIDWRKIGIYQDIYQDVDPMVLHTLPFWRSELGNKLDESLDPKVWETIEKLCSEATTPEDFRAAMMKVRSWERGKFKWLTYHTLNIIVWSMYLAYIKRFRLKWSDDIAMIGEAYNGSRTKVEYGQSVASYAKAGIKAPFPRFRQANPAFAIQDKNTRQS